MVIQLLAVLAASVVVGLALVALGWRGRRLNDHPVCGDCGFDLSHVLPDGVTCPECGGGLRRPKGVRRGQRRRRPLVLALGLLLAGLPLLTVGALAFGSAAGVDWARHKPVWLLAWEAEGGEASRVDALARELARRDAAGTLSGADIGRAGEAILAVQGNPDGAWDERLGDFIEQQAIRGALGEDVRRAFYSQAPVVTFRTRERVAAGGSVVLEPELVQARVGTGTQVYGMLLLERATLGGVPLDPDHDFGPDWAGEQFGNINIWRNPGWGAMNDHVSGVLRRGVPASVAPGVHEFACEVRLVLQEQGQPFMMNWGRLGADERPGRVIRWSGAVVVEPAGTEIVEVVEPTEAMTREIALALGPGYGNVWDSGGMGTQMHVSFQDSSSLPVPVVGWVKATWNGRSWRAGAVCLRAERPAGRGFTYSWDGSWDSAPPEGFDAREIDVVIVPDVKLALGTTDVTRIYGGEIPVRGVPVQWQDAVPGQIKPRPGNPVRDFLRGLLQTGSPDKGGGAAGADPGEGAGVGPAAPSDD